MIVLGHLTTLVGIWLCMDLASGGSRQIGRSIIVTVVLASAAAFVLASGSGCAEARPDPTEAPQPTPSTTVQISPLRATATAKALSRAATLKALAGTATAKASSGTGQSQSGSDLDQLLRDIRAIERWVTANTGNLSRCVESGRIDWSRYATSLEVSAIILTEAGLDWADGRADSYTPYEVKRSVTVMQENIQELKSKCGL